MNRIIRKARQIPFLTPPSSPLVKGTKVVRPEEFSLGRFADNH
ncbi:hypothetical protein [Limibacterium fermenti]